MSNNTLLQLQQGDAANTLTTGSIDWWMDFPDPSDWIVPLFSKASAVQGGMNSSFWWSPKLEQMFNEAQTMTDPRRASPSTPRCRSTSPRRRRT